MTEDDLFALFRPSGQSQGPKLREAIKSLKLVKKSGGQLEGVAIYEKKLLTKRQKDRRPFLKALELHTDVIHSPLCQFDIENLPDQVQQECVQPTNWDNPSRWGNVHEQAVGYCESLIARMLTLIHSPELECLFGKGGQSLVAVLESFFASEDRDILLDHNPVGIGVDFDRATDSS